MRNVALALSFAFVGALLAACSGTSQTNGFGDGTGNGNGNGGGPGGGGLLGGNGTDGGGGTMGGSTGQVDKSAACDTGLAVDGDASSFAKAIGICTDASSGFGLVSASYAKGFGTNAAPVNGQWGLLPKFGNVIKPREGSTLGVLSSGYAREYDSIDGTPGKKQNGISANDFVAANALYQNDPVAGMGGQQTGQAPQGFPKAAAGCQQDNKVNDMIDVKLTLKAPMDASGFQFDFNFYSSEWPNYVCSNYNDAFVAYLTASTVKGDNISFDSNSNPVAVNNNFLNRCTPNTAVGCLRSDTASPFNPDPPLSTSACAGGTDELGGTGYADTTDTLCQNPQTATLGGATGWLTTQAPVAPGETFTLDFMIWDAGDGVLDSSVLIDNFQWIGGTVTTGTSRVN